MVGGTADRIVAATRAIVVAQGSQGVSMRKVAVAVGVTPMTIYRHFADREALLGVVADKLFSELGQRWRGRPWSEDLEADARARLAEHVEFALRQPRLYAFLFTEPRAGARRYPDDFVDGASPTLSIVTDLLTEGIRRGHFSPHDVAEQALVVAAEVHGLVQLYHGGRIALDETAFVELCQRATAKVLDSVRA